MKFEKINDSNVLEGYCLIKQVEVKKTAKGSSYLDLTLADTEGETNAKFWDYKESPECQFEAYDFIKVRGSFVPFNDTLQFRIDRIRKVIPEDNVNLDDYVPSACLPGNVMLSEIKSIVETFGDLDLKILVQNVLEKYEDELIYWPAAKNLHHSVRSGLLMHTLSILRMCEAVCKIYSFVNYDLLCSGAILHDIAKILEINSSKAGIAGEYTVKGNLIGHLVLGAIEIDRIGNELGIDENKLMLVEHMLISHHGVPEFGAAKLPMFVEAMVLSELDNFDARIYEFNFAVNSVNPGDFTPKQWALENRILFNHGLNNDGKVNLI